MDLYFLSAAQVELDQVFVYLESAAPGLGYRFTADVDGEIKCRRWRDGGNRGLPR